MTTRPYELLARFAADGSVAGVSVRTITTVNGRDFEGDPEPLSGTDDPAFADFAQAFAATAVAERDQLASDKQSLESQLATITAERDSLPRQLELATERGDNLQSQYDDASSLLSSTTAQLWEAQSTIAHRDATIAEREETIAGLQAELDALRNPPVNPRHVAPYVFLSLLTPAEIYALQTSTDSIVVLGRAKLQTIITHVDLDNAETIELVQYMERAGLAAEGRAAQILAGEMPV